MDTAKRRRWRRKERKRERGKGRGGWPLDVARGQARPCCHYRGDGPRPDLIEQREGEKEREKKEGDMEGKGRKSRGRNGLWRLLEALRRR